MSQTGWKFVPGSDLMQLREGLILLDLVQDYLAWKNCSSRRVTAGDQFYSLYKSASVEYTVYRIK
jgi:hypothetical protein